MPLPKGTGRRPAEARLGRSVGSIAQYLGHGLAGLAGYLIGGVHGAIEGTAATRWQKAALDAMKRSGISRTEDLLTEALLNPELAKTLLMKATPANRPFIAQLAYLSARHACCGGERARRRGGQASARDGCTGGRCRSRYRVRRRCRVRQTMWSTNRPAGNATAAPSMF